MVKALNFWGLDSGIGLSFRALGSGGGPADHKYLWSLSG
jgi:hypothetical protein